MPEPNMKSVKIYRVKDDISGILREAVAGSGLRGKGTVFIKPNLSHPEYLPGVVTCPELMAELVGLLRDGNSKVIVGESNGFNYPCWTAFDKTGVQAAVEKAGGTVINLSEDKVVEVKFQGNTPLKRLFLPKTVLDADAVADLPLMKTHEFTAYSGAIKNLFGCVPSNRRIYLHPYLPEVFYRLYTIFKPQLTVMDARVGIEGNGPTKGKPIKMDLMLTGNDALALDITAAKIMKLNWKQTYLGYIASKTGLREENIAVDGLRVDEVARRFEPPRIDLPVKAQMMIYRHEYLTKFFFCSLDVVKLFQKVTMAYRGESTQVG
ncbi:MAG: DUF362 domain-containing protein [Candidatus Bathyarchaeota archaeon]|nr:DUF362 domain-containing protein [Candidatus Bathyarchaeota archaeon]